MQCCFTKALMEKYDLEDPVIPHILLLMAKLLKLHIADVECRHAAVRRLLLRVQAKFEMEEAGSTVLHVGSQNNDRWWFWTPGLDWHSGKGDIVSLCIAIILKTTL